MTLREICETLEVSRRAIQGYENAGLVKATEMCIRDRKSRKLIRDADTDSDDTVTKRHFMFVF